MPPILVAGALAPRAGTAAAPLEPLGATRPDRGDGSVPAGAWRRRGGTANQAITISATAGIRTRRPRIAANKNMATTRLNARPSSRNRIICYAPPSNMGSFYRIQRFEDPL